MSQKKSGPEYTIEMEKDENYKTIFCNGVLTNLTLDGGSLVFYLDNDELKIDQETGVIDREKILRKLQIEIRMSPLAFIPMAKWLNTISEDFEKSLREFYKK